MITKERIIEEVQSIRGILDNEGTANSKLDQIDYHVNQILIGSIKDPHDKHRGAYYKQ